MKKVIFISALAIAAAVSCTKSDIVDTKFNEAISFENYVGRDAMTKAAVTNLAALKASADGIGLYGFYTGAKEWKTDGIANPAANLWNNVKLYWDAEATTPSWVYEGTPKYWTNTTDWYSFLAYAPKATTNGVSVTGNNANDVKVTYTCPVTDGKLTTNVDLVYAQVVNTHKATPVQLQFKHALSRLTVKAYAPENDMEIKFDVKNVTISGKFNTKGALTLATAAAAEAGDTGWAPDPAVATANVAYEFYNDRTAANKGDGTFDALPATFETAVDYAFKGGAANNYLMMIPTEFTADNTAILSVTYTTIYEGQESNEMTKELPIATNFKMGKAYAISLKFEPILDVITFDVLEVDGWGTEGEVTATGGNNPESFNAKQN